MTVVDIDPNRLYLEYVGMQSIHINYRYYLIGVSARLHKHIFKLITVVRLQYVRILYYIKLLTYILKYLIMEFFFYTYEICSHNYEIII